MKLTRIQVAAALDAISEDIEQASSSFDAASEGHQPWELESAEWRIELAYSKLLVLCEVLDLPILRGDISGVANLMRANPLAGATETWLDRPYLKWSGPARKFHQTLQTIFLTESSQSVTKDIEAIVRGSLYSIVDPLIYGSPPKNEADVHRRLEGVIKCIFPDTLHAPALAKPIKNFFPDTGIPSIKTAIEYKFLSDRSQIGIIADEILADTRGYAADRWTSFLYVIYETERFRPETEWRQLLRESGNADEASVIVLSGASARAKARRMTKPKTGSDAVKPAKTRSGSKPE